MAKGPTTLSEVREQEYVQSVGTAAWGIGIFIVALILIAALKYMVPHSILQVSRVAAGLAALAGLALVAAAISRSMKMNKCMGIVTFKCPYCEVDNQLVREPTEDFDCDSCLRTIRFENGKMVPIRTITCTNCGAHHRVSVKAERFVCDKCNATMQLHNDQPVYGMTVGTAPAPVPRQATMLGGHNENVLIQALDHSREHQVALILQRELGVDLQEARRLLGTITEKTPLIVAYDIVHDEADALRRQLENLGATVVTRITAGSRA